MARTVYDVLIEQISGDRAAALDFLAGGGAKDFAEYKEVSGLIRGLNASIGHITDLARSQMEDDYD